MYLQPSESLTEKQVQSGLKSIIADGMFAEAMIALTGGTFLVAMALQMGATNFHLGILAALPTFSSIFQLASIWLVRKYNNRRAITVVMNIFGRLPLFFIAVLPFLFTAGTSIKVLMFLLFFHYLFGAVAGPSWNSWIKDLVPDKQLGSYFSHRGRLTQTLNVFLSLALALGLDYIKVNYSAYELPAYAIMFAMGGVLGMLGVYALAKTPEPKSHLANEDIFKLLGKAFTNKNYKNLLLFNSAWAFALNIATPFFVVLMMKTLGFPLSYVIGFGILGQLSSILSIRMWGRYSDRFSNKTILNICAPVYIACIIGWVFVSPESGIIFNITLLAVINILSGISTSGINLALNNIGLKLAPKEEAIAYLTSKNMMVAAFSAISPIIGGLMADFFLTQQFSWDLQWNTATETHVFRILDLKGWNFLFIIGGFLALLSLRLLSGVKEAGEVRKERVMFYMRSKLRRNIASEARWSLRLVSLKHYARKKQVIGF